MQGHTYGSGRRKLILLPCVIIIFAVIFSSTTIASAIITPLLFPQNQTSIEIKTLNYKGANLIMTAKYTEAIAYFDEALAINPNDVSALTGKAVALGGLGKYTEAVAYYDKALAINPNSFIAMKEKEFTLAAIRHSNSTNSSSTGH